MAFIDDSVPDSTNTKSEIVITVNTIVN
jgi:hypothetical protein